MAYVGEIAALTVALLWAAGSLLFAWLGGRIGALNTNALRLAVAALILTAALAVTTGQPFPVSASNRQIALLAASGLIGLLAGDGCYFRSLLLIGPRRATLFMSLAPPITALIGWVALDERLGPLALLGMALTLGGTASVVLDRTAAFGGEGRILLGSLFGVGAAAGQALGLVMSKAALPGMSALAGAVIRMQAATLAAWLLLLAKRRGAEALAALRPPGVVPRLLAAAIVGPVLGMSLSLYAIEHTTTAVAATLMALVPVVILPMVMVVHGERPTARATLGALVAVAGVALLLLRDA